MKRCLYMSSVISFICVLVLKSSASCTMDQDCSLDTQLCCNGFCMAWQSCKDSCRVRTDCEWKKNQICHKHRCTVDMSLEYTICVEDKDCGAIKNSHCQDNRCISLNITPRNSEHGGQVAWIKALFITGSVVLSLLACVVVYCYRKRCTSPPRYLPTAFPLQRTTFGRDNHHDNNTVNIEESVDNEVISQQPNVDYRR